MKHKMIMDPNQVESEVEQTIEWFLRESVRGDIEIRFRSSEDGFHYLVARISPQGLALATGIVDDIGIAKNTESAVEFLGTKVIS